MNILIFEIKKNLKAFYVWTISLLLTLLALMGGMYPIYMESKVDVLKLLENFPPQFTDAFGVNLSTIFTFEGFYSFSYVYIGIIGAIMAVAISIATFGREKRFKCTDFLLTKPICREKIFMYKLLSNVVIIVATNLFFVAASVVAFLVNKDREIAIGLFILGTLCLFLIQCVFMSIGIFFAVISKKIRSIAGVATAFGFGAFILSAMANVIKEEWVEFLAPLKYFEPQAIFFNNGFQAKYIIAALILIIACLSIAFIKYCKQDTYAV